MEYTLKDMPKTRSYVGLRPLSNVNGWNYGVLLVDYPLIKRLGRTEPMHTGTPLLLVTFLRLKTAASSVISSGCIGYFCPPNRKVTLTSTPHGTTQTPPIPLTVVYSASVKRPYIESATVLWCRKTRHKHLGPFWVGKQINLPRNLRQTKTTVQYSSRSITLLFGNSGSCLNGLSIRANDPILV